MDERRFDALARVLASSKTRRGYLAGVLAFLGVSALAVRGTNDTAHASCREEDESCTLNSSCCRGLTCVSTSLFNPNIGVCQPGSEPNPNPTRSPVRRTPTRTPTRRPARTPNRPPNRTPNRPRKRPPKRAPTRSPALGSTPAPTPKPTPKPAPTPGTGTDLSVPMTVTINCAVPPAEQSIVFAGRFGPDQQLPIEVVQIRSFLGDAAGNRQPGPSLARDIPHAVWRWRCSTAVPGTVCKSLSQFFQNDLGTDGVAMHIRYEQIDCDAQMSCIAGSNPDGFLQCVRR